jgi:hypothetical protein
MSDYASITAEAEAAAVALQNRHRAALEAQAAKYPCCREYNAEGALRARERGYEWQPALCQQHREWERIGWMLHTGTRGYSAGEVEAA